MFHGLGTDETRLVLQACEFRRVTGGESVCLVNGLSDEMYILLNGQLGVYNEGDMLLASIDPVAPVGEMGLITGQPRSATVNALLDSNLLVLRKVAFDRLMRTYSQICARVYRSVIEALGQRLGESRAERQRVAGRCLTLEGKLNDIVEGVTAVGNDREETE